MSDARSVQLERLEIAGIELSESEKKKYLANGDVIKDFVEGDNIPEGYKRCGGCKQVKKLYMFNKNNSAKDRSTGNCKVCQKAAAQASYKRNKHKRDYKKYYAKNREKKLEHNRRYYEENKEEILAKQREYYNSGAGKKVMKKAHAKRRRLLKKNQGIPYQREWVIERDKVNGMYPICYLCNKPIREEEDIHIDHVQPIVGGGLDCFSNVASTHRLCNLSRPKDGRDLTKKMVKEIVDRAEEYMDSHMDLFDLD